MRNEGDIWFPLKSCKQYIEIGGNHDYLFEQTLQLYLSIIFKGTESTALLNWEVRP